MNVSTTFRTLAAVLLLAGLDLPAEAQAPTIEGVLVEPANPTVHDVVELVVVGRQSPECPFVVGQPSFDPVTGLYRIQTSDPPCDTPATEPFEKRLTLGKLAAGFYQIEIQRGASALPWREQLRVSEARTFVSLHADRFRAFVEWRNPRDGSRGTGSITKLTDESAAFWFFSPSNVEITLKVLDGRPLNGHWWVFLASMTDLETKVTVLENVDNCLLLPVFPPACPTRTYQQAAGSNRNFIDVRAFSE